MGLLDKLKAIVEECDEDGGEDGGAVADAPAEEAGLDGEEGQADAPEGAEGEPEAKAPAPKAPARKKAGRAARARKPEHESEGTDDAEESEEEADDQGCIEEAIGRLEAQVKELQDAARQPKGTTGLKPEGVAKATDAEVRRWREIAGLED